VHRLAGNPRPVVAHRADDIELRPDSCVLPTVKRSEFPAANDDGRTRAAPPGASPYTQPPPPLDYQRAQDERTRKNLMEEP